MRLVLIPFLVALALFHQVRSEDSAALSKHVEVNGNRIVLPAPVGYGEVTSGDSPRIFALGEQTAKADPMNERLAFFVPVDLMDKDKNNLAYELSRYFQVKVTTAVKNRKVSKAEFAQYKNVMKTQSDQILKRVEEVIPDAMKKLSKGISDEFDVNFGASTTSVAMS